VTIQQLPLSEADATIVAAGLLAKFRRANRVAQVCTEKYTGEILGKGSTVKILTVGDVSLQDYQPGVTQITPERVSDFSQLVHVDQAKAFSFEVDDVVAALGASAYLQGAAENAGKQLAQEIDTFLANTILAGANVNHGTIEITNPEDAYKALIGIRTEFAQYGQTIKVLIPSDFYGLLLQDKRFVGTGFVAQFNGMVGEAVGMSIIESQAANGHVLAVLGDDAVASVTAINKVEAFRPQNSFGNAIKGLAVYGAKVIRPSAVAKLAYTIA
jgi:hypothetical protein